VQLAERLGSRLAQQALRWVLDVDGHLAVHLGFSSESVSNRCTVSNNSSNALGCVEVCCVTNTMIVLRDAAVASHNG